VYKVLALNCLVSAYMMSALYLRGLKQGDTQMTATGLVIAALFFFLSQVWYCWLVLVQKCVVTHYYWC
jgi:cation-transporting ATPase 13A1